MIYKINFYSTQYDPEPYDQWECELTLAFATREKAVAYAQVVAFGRHFDTFTIGEDL